MNPVQADLHRFFTDKAKHLQKEIDTEIKAIGGEKMLISRTDVLHWVYDAREQIKTYWTICRMLEDRAAGIDTEKILNGLQENITEERYEIERLQRKQEEEKKALKELRAEAEYYRLALEVLGKQK